MRSTTIVRNASVPVVTDRVTPRGWEFEHAPAAMPVRDRTKQRDDLRGARGIFVAVAAGTAIWIALGWGAMTLIDRLVG